MTCSVRWSRSGSSFQLLLVVALALGLGACRQPPVAPDDAARARAAALVPTDLALAFLQQVKSDPASSLLAGELTVAPCRFTDKGTWSAGEYRKVTGQRAPTFITPYASWVLFKIEDANGRDFLPADLERPGTWVYSLRTPTTARTVFGTTDRCVVGPTGEPARKVVEALAALGVALPPDLGYIVR
jgi:hypothetical protein